MGYATLTEKLFRAIDRLPSDRAVTFKANGRWEAVSSAEFLRRIAGISNALEQVEAQGSVLHLMSPPESGTPSAQKNKSQKAPT